MRRAVRCACITSTASSSSWSRSTRAGGGLFRQLVALNNPSASVRSRPDVGDRLFDPRLGSDVYFCVNPLRELVDTATGEPEYHRRRSHVAAVRTIGMDMDDGGAAGIARLADDVADGLLPPPHLVVQTSHGLVGQADRRRYHQKCHLLWAAADAADVSGGFTVRCRPCCVPMRSRIGSPARSLPPNPAPNPARRLMRRRARSRRRVVAPAPPVQEAGDAPYRAVDTAHGRLHPAAVRRHAARLRAGY